MILSRRYVFFHLRECANASESFGEVEIEHLTYLKGIENFFDPGSESE